MATKKPDKMTLVEAKRILRIYAVRRRQLLSAKQRSQKSRAIAKNLFRTASFRRANVVAAFIGFGSEVDTDLIIKESWKRGKTVVIPMTPLGFHKPFFTVFHSGDPLKKTSHGPLEPRDKKEPFPWTSIDLVLAPGLGFDRKGHRLGYGGGVYDRVLEKTPRSVHLGLFFSAQEMHALPLERHDQSLQAIVTELGVTSHVKNFKI